MNQSGSMLLWAAKLWMAVVPGDAPEMSSEAPFAGRSAICLSPGEPPRGPRDLLAAIVDSLPAPDDLPPALDELPPAADDLPPALAELPPAEDELPPAPDDLPPALDELPPAAEELPPGPDDLPPALDELPPAVEELPPAPDDLPLAPNEIPPLADPKTELPPPKATAVAPPPDGSQVPPHQDFCSMCHTERDIWTVDMLSLHLSRDDLEDDAHWRAGVNCHDCHGGNHRTADFLAAHAGMRSGQALHATCNMCHQDQVAGLLAGVHAEAGPTDERGHGTPLNCTECHGGEVHRLLPARHPDSPMFIAHQVETCGACHADDRTSYVESVHGRGLYRAGLVVTAACADCHGAHEVHPATDRRSLLYPANVAGTCGTCHHFIEERLAQSVHGGGDGPGTMSDLIGPCGTNRRYPTCTDCHQGHDLADPRTFRFRQELPNRCGDCHAELFDQFAMSIHGQLTHLGHGPAARCADCHGAHDILPVHDAASRVAPENRRQTCQACHPRMTGNVLMFDPHADHTNPQRSPVEYYVYRTLLMLIYTVFGFFGVHSLLWFVRSLVEVARHGRPRGLQAGHAAYFRFRPFHRTAHLCLMTAFLGLALTGLPLKYSHHGWAQNLVGVLGGFESTSFWHRVFALVTFGCFAAMNLRLFHRYLDGRRRGRSRLDAAFGPDSPLPLWRDVQDFGRMVRWFFGLGPKPTFDRWSYWEKFDFWGAFADVAILGTTGMILWFPTLLGTFLPGVTFNVAKVIHSTQALLATGFVFAIHFFNTHLRPEKFPADMSVLTGLVSEEELREERGDYFDRLHAEGRLDEFRTVGPPGTRLLAIKLSGFVALFIGLSLLAAMIAIGLGAE